MVHRNYALHSIPAIWYINMYNAQRYTQTPDMSIKPCVAHVCFNLHLYLIFFVEEGDEMLVGLFHGCE